MTNPNRRAVLGLAVAVPLAALGSRAQAATHQVAIRGFAFVPAAITVAVGDTVIFTNEDSAPHTATDDAGAWDTGRLSGGATAQLTFNGAATFAYHCAFHPNMTASITIA